jgi:hypothetical protein
VAFFIATYFWFTKKHVMHQYINLMIVVVALLVTYNLLNRFNPITSTPIETKLSLKELKLKYGALNKWLILGTVISTILLTFPMFWVLDFIVNFRLSLLYDVMYIIAPDYRVILVNAACISFLISTIIFANVASYKTLTEWEDYVAFINQYYRFDVFRVNKYFNRTLSLCVILLSILTLDWYTTFGDEEIKTNNFWGIGNRVYEYNNIVEIKDVKKRSNILGELVDKPFCVMTFRDNYKWLSPLITPKQKDDILGLVLARTNIYKKEVDSDLEL